MTKTVYANGRYTGTFRWGREGEAIFPVKLSKNDHGWFCDEVNGQPWVYPPATYPDGGWGAQFAKDTPLKALRGFLRQWDACGDTSDAPDDCGGVCTTADRLTIRPADDD